VRAVAKGTQLISSYDVLERIAEGLQIDRGLVGLGFMAPPAAAQPSHRGPEADDPVDPVAQAASDSAADAARNSIRIGDDSIEDLHEQLVAHARRYADLPAFEGFAAVRKSRDAAQRMREQTRVSGQIADLSVVISVSDALLASLAFDLGRFDAAGTLGRAAASHGEAARHPSSYTWAQGLLALLANWQGDPDRALEHCRRALARPAPAAARYRIRFIAARAHGLRGDVRELAEELLLAEGEHDRARTGADDLNDGIGGELRFDEARATACAATAWLDAGDGVRAEQSAQAALSLHRRGANSLLKTSMIAGVSIDLAAASLLQGDLGGARERLAEAFAIVPGHTGTALTGRLQRITALVNTPRWATDPTAQQLTAMIKG
jgi:hypothetical protein